MARRRSWLRLLAEVQALGVASDPAILLKPLAALAGAVAEGGRDKEAAHAAAAILAAFAKAGREEFLGFPLQLPHIAPGSPAALAVSLPSSLFSTVPDPGSGDVSEGLLLGVGRRRGGAAAAADFRAAASTP